MRLSTRLLTMALAAVLPMLLVLTAAPVFAQAFPVSGGTLTEMEAEADRLVEEAKRAEARRAELEKRQAENAERWDDFEDFIEDRVKEIQREVSRGEAKELLNNLNARKSYYVMGALYYNLGAWSNAKKYLGQSVRAENPQWQAASLVRLSRLELVDVFEGKTPDRYESRLEREIPKVGEKLDKALEKVNVSRRDAEQRAQMGSTDDYTGNLLDWLRREQDLRKRIQEDTWDSEAIWSLVRLYRDNLRLHHLARAWLELLRERFGSSARVLEGQVSAELARIMVGQGFAEQAQQQLNAGDAAEEVISELEVRIKEIEQKIIEANRAGRQPDLSDEEIEISKMDPQKLRKRQEENFKNARNDIKRVRDAINEAAGVRHEGDDRDERRRNRRDGR